MNHLYHKGLTKVDIINLVKFIDRMMTLPPPLQTEFQTKLNDYEKELNMPFLSTIEENAQEKGAKITRQDDIIKILSTRFDNLPEKIIYNIKQIDNMSILENLLLPSINLNSLEEFQTLIDAELQQK
ncbi:hypothetical protein [Nodularia spumigena]|uniref:Uncharacterized protein n=1 Tax=Nodularia spumigena UHCC 0060 TaxID=3110300 RepID=A0ABU5UU69_NODSP|nr:hypothetical protein [Nodularia spumigena]MEA5526936.1 hypothetical protein [Nodularia spumigena UHCC 0143]MEA5609824.1 hypothetical protein [Nodularia spumigena UHCC 0060]